MLLSTCWSDCCGTSEISAESYVPVLGAGDQQGMGEVLLDLLLWGKKEELDRVLKVQLNKDPCSLIQLALLALIEGLA